LKISEEVKIKYCEAILKECSEKQVKMRKNMEV
jgi:hypothetical protein